LGAARAEDKDMRIIRERLRELFMSADLSGQSEAAAFRDAQNSDGAWDDIDYACQGLGKWDAHRHLARALVMARAFRDKNSGFYLDSGMSAAARAAARRWVVMDLRNPNWWWNEIGVPRTMGEIALILDDAMPEMERKAVMPLLKRPVSQRTGQNLLWALVQRVIHASLEESEPDMADVSRLLAGLLVIQPQGCDGIQSDGSFHQHDRTLYSCGYGRSFASDCVILAHALSGTRFAMTPEQLSVIALFLLDGIQWMSRGPAFDYSAAGRDISRCEPDSVTQRLRGGGSLSELGAPGLFSFMSRLPTERNAEFARAAERYAKIVRGEPDPGVGGVRYFHQSDFLVQNERDFYISVRSHSDRLFNTDFPCCGGEGLKSHCLADGCSLIMRSGWEYHRVFPCWDWKKIPGTTELQTAWPLTLETVRRKGTSPFSGGMGGREYGLACMDFIRGGLRARKAWFLSPSGMLALGAGVSCGEVGEVETTVNQCLLKGPVRVRDKSGVSAPPPGGSRILESPCDVEHDGVVYSFPERDTRVRVTAETRKGDWFEINKGKFKSSSPVACDVFTLGVLHGAEPVSASYAYCVIPGAAGGAARAAAGEMRIVSNTGSCQAAAYADRAEKKQVCQAVFYEPGTVSPWPGLTLDVDNACLLRVSERSGGAVEITLANPLHGPLDLTVTAHQRLDGGDAEWSGAGGVSRIRFSLPGGAEAGSAVTKSARKI
jgi:chondroitin AC lyase